jgi:hypothetical protein
MPTLLMMFVVGILVVTLVVARDARRREARLERDNETMRSELDRHRQAAQAILRELQNP